ncbi:LysR family transcriptional regulator [Rothia sp. AR01]|uniref:LysR family transcriptional regulator n=1 Tax=Rothia santali TaxID=2949643 RepID=A0A9X2HEA4_9MICC|nr:LysR family transcriptional regulator [Rothia santali]MCP3425222.1 LysR family transcriptional regulator [Rothia santali]
MDRRSLEYFRAVAQFGSVSAGALAMSVTQPAVSKQLAQLEAGLAVKLFHRTPTGMAMTAAGEELYGLSGDVLTRFARIEGTIRARFAGYPEIRIASPHTTATVLITPFMVDTDPPIADLLIVNAPEVDALLERDADMAVSTMRPPAHREQMVVADLIIRVQGAPDAMRARFSDRTAADLELLHDASVIVPRTGVHAVVDTVVAAFAEPLSIRTSSTGRIAQGLAANDHGFALVTEVADFGLAGLPAYADGRLVVSPLYASWDAQHYARDQLRSLAVDFSYWMSVTPPWDEPNRIGYRKEGGSNL